MAIVNFTIPKALEVKVKKTVKQAGYSSKAEFFRVAAIDKINDIEKNPELTRRKMLVNAIKYEMKAKLKGKRIPSVEEQLADL